MDVIINKNSSGILYEMKVNIRFRKYYSSDNLYEKPEFTNIFKSILLVNK